METFFISQKVGCPRPYANIVGNTLQIRPISWKIFKNHQFQAKGLDQLWEFWHQVQYFAAGKYLYLIINIQNYLQARSWILRKYQENQIHWSLHQFLILFYVDLYFKLRICLRQSQYQNVGNHRPHREVDDNLC